MLRYVSCQTDRHIHMLITILCTPYGGQSTGDSKST